MDNDTIAAVSTPPGQSGIGIVRLSGKDAISIAKRVFFSPKEIDILKIPSHSVRYGWIKNQGGDTVDEVLITIMKAPSTYTREDIVEINAHGGIVPIKEIMRELLKNGARLAQPGEFTKRAFLNGRIDLAQAEAVADIIKAKTIGQARASIRQLKGFLSGEIMKIKEALLDTLVQIEADIDFPEEHLSVKSRNKLLDSLKNCKTDIEKLLFRAETGRFLREGARVVIAGRPNVGKSSLLNTLLSRERAIVAPIPGTTRDTVEDEIELDGNLVRLIDTAGLCEAEDIVEKEGIKRTKDSIEECDLVLFLLDAAEGITEQDKEIFFLLRGAEKKIVLALNKIDLPNKADEKALLEFSIGYPSITISATRRTNIEGLLDIIKGVLWNGKGRNAEGDIIVSLRHEDILKRTDGKILDIMTAFQENQSEELIAIDIKETLSFLGEITGETHAEDILDRIFSRFCIGK